MSHEQAHEHRPTGGSAPHQPEYGIFASQAPLPSNPNRLSASQTDQHGSGPPASPVVAAMAVPHSSSGLTLVERWALRTSDTSFNALAGAIGGFTSGIVTCPLDVIKTKLQAQGGFAPVSRGRHVGHNHKVYEGLVGTARVIWREEGIRGLYRGLGPIILGYLPTWAVWFTVYNKSKVFMAEHHVQNSFVINFWSSIVAGASSTIVTNPIWVIKTRLMSQTARKNDSHASMFPRSGNTPTSRPPINSSWHYTSTLDAARKMYSSEGVLSFYSGLTPALLGLTHVAVQFPAYEYLRKKFTGTGMGEISGENEQTHWLGVLSASILSKILASSATYPHEVIRTRLQTQRRPTAGTALSQGSGVTAAGGANGKALSQGPKPQPKYRGVFLTFQTILREEGWRAFYAGMGVNMMRAVPAATVTMMTYEYVMKQLHHAQIEGRRKQGLAVDLVDGKLPEP